VEITGCVPWISWIGAGRGCPIRSVLNLCQLRWPPADGLACVQFSAGVDKNSRGGHS
jgi:hypothetical protein